MSSELLIRFTFQKYKARSDLYKERSTDLVEINMC